MKYVHVYGYATWHILDRIDDATGSYIAACSWNFGPCQVHMVVLDGDRLRMPAQERVCQKCKAAHIANQGIEQLSFLEVS
jgi:hypothetical protein